MNAKVLRLPRMKKVYKQFMRIILYTTKGNLPEYDHTLAASRTCISKEDRDYP